VDRTKSWADLLNIVIGLAGTAVGLAEIRALEFGLCGGDRRRSFAVGIYLTVLTSPASLDAIGTAVSKARLG
jgi:hypothetical protein